MTTSPPQPPPRSEPGSLPQDCVHGGSPPQPLTARAAVPAARSALRRWAKLAIFFGCAGAIVFFSVSRERMADSLHLLKAEKMVKNERWDEAYRSYHDLVRKHQGDTNVLLSYAEAAVRTGHHEEASRALEALHGRHATDRQMRRVSLVSAALERAGFKAPARPAPVPLSLN